MVKGLLEAMRRVRDARAKAAPAAFTFAEGEDDDPSLSDRVDAVREAIRAKFATTAKPYPDVYAVDVREKSLIYSQDGKYYRATWTAEGAGITFGQPESVVRRTEWDTAFAFADEALTEFASKETVDGVEYIVRRGKLTEEGDYPDKGVSFDATDLYAAAHHFRPVQNDLEHKASPLDGHLGSLRSVWPVVNDKTKKVELHGEAAIPAYIQKIYGKDPIKVSLAWSRGKRIVGNALVRNPRIKDAALVAAFNDEAKGPEQTPMKLTLATLFSGLGAALAGGASDPNAEIDLTTFGQGGTPPTPAPTPAGGALTPTPAGAAVAFADDPAWKAMQGQLATMQNLRLADAGKDYAKSCASGAAFSDGKPRLLPNGVDYIATKYAEAARADAAAAGVALFSSADGSVAEGPNLKALKSYMASQNAVAFTGEMLEDTSIIGGGHDFGAGGGTGAAVTDERKKKLLSMTETGRQALKKMDKGG